MTQIFESESERLQASIDLYNAEELEKTRLKLVKKEMVKMIFRKLAWALRGQPLRSRKAPLPTKNDCMEETISKELEAKIKLEAMTTLLQRMHDSIKDVSFDQIKLEDTFSNKIAYNYSRELMKQYILSTAKAIGLTIKE